MIWNRSKYLVTFYRHFLYRGKSNVILTKDCLHYREQGDGVVMKADAYNRKGISFFFPIFVSFLFLYLYDEGWEKSEVLFVLKWSNKIVLFWKRELNNYIILLKTFDVFSYNISLKKKNNNNLQFLSLSLNSMCLLQ